MDYIPRTRQPDAEGLVGIAAVLRDLQRISLNDPLPRLSNLNSEPCGEFPRPLRNYESKAEEY